MFSNLAITISLYNRWDELGGLLELLRDNWSEGEKLYVIVNSTAEEEEMPEWVDKNLANHFQFGSPFPMPNLSRDVFSLKHPFGTFLSKTTPLAGCLERRQRQKVKKATRSRTVESFVRGGRKGIESGRKYLLHLHAATWPLSEQFVRELLEKMEEKNSLFSGRGFGKKFVTEKLPAGDIDDNFFIINNHFADRVGFWDFDPALDVETVSNEGRLARRVYEKIPEDKVCFFDNFSKPEEYIFPEGATHRRVQPFNYHKPTKILRSHDMNWQAKLCKEENIKGRVIDQIIKDNL